MSVTTPRNRLALCAASTAAATLMLAIPSVPAHAQDYDYDAGPGGDVTIYASPREERDPATGAPYERVRASRVVSYADLDLNARWGVRELRARVVRAARDACGELENDPTVVTAPDDPPCVSTAVRRAMYQAPIPDYFQDDAYGY
ncbi:MAG TPA: UrcA family protein [Caulobacteraceae bacterium]|jgi:UrcA family protein|nr:UrcA family protein [Caulobacteraceae bacterium]